MSRSAGQAGHGSTPAGAAGWRRDSGAPISSSTISASPDAVVQARVDIGPEAPLVKHTHPVEEIIYILEGSLEYQVDGEPPKTFNAGDALTVPAGVE
jgi:quercetin dioxygenase-like cupin family protein